MEIAGNMAGKQTPSKPGRRIRRHWETVQGVRNRDRMKDRKQLGRGRVLEHSSTLREGAPATRPTMSCSPLRVGSVAILRDGNGRRSWKAGIRPQVQINFWLTQNRDQGATLASISTQPVCPPYPPTVRQLMEGAESGEKSEKDSPPLQIDPKWYVQCHDGWVADR